MSRRSEELKYNAWLLGGRSGRAFMREQEIVMNEASNVMILRQEMEQLHQFKIRKLFKDYEAQEKHDDELYNVARRNAIILREENERQERHKLQRALTKELAGLQASGIALSNRRRVHDERDIAEDNIHQHARNEPIQRQARRHDDGLVEHFEERHVEHSHVREDWDQQLEDRQQRPVTRQQRREFPNEHDCGDDEKQEERYKDERRNR